MADLFMMGHLVRDCSTARCLKRGPGCLKDSATSGNREGTRLGDGMLPMDWV